MAVINPVKKSNTRWRLLWRLATLLGGVFNLGHARAVTLPEDSAEAMFHYYNGGGVIADGPALLVRKSLADSFSLTAGYYLDAVTNASIDVVTTASKYKENRSEYNVGFDYLYRDSKITFSTSESREPDYIAKANSLDISQETFGGMTTVNVGFTRGEDNVYKHNEPNFKEFVSHWQYRLGVSQVLSAHWVMSLNGEVVSDNGYLQSPYRVARVFGAAVPENDPTTRSSRALDVRLIGDLGNHDAVHMEVRHFWDNWNIKANNLELGYSRYFGENWLADTSLRYYKQTKALFYSDNAASDTFYISRNRQLSDFADIGIGAKVAYTLKREGATTLKLNASYELTNYKYNDFTDLRTGGLYSFKSNLLQLYVTANF
ncbi:hypothetical protein AAKU67_000726 [Oxalobacteraceae bacterium GrIS 2.11]